ncbi:MAG: hypothetical protein KKC51_02730, partial [Verrucomicrobia bacterium]|nr:hypothetical protein [Verrucomicrobiota bacterium]
RDVGPGIFVIGIFGGSSASIFSWLGREELVRALRERLPEIGDDITVLNCGGGGYKQPQQTIALMLCLLLGIRFDVIVNLDGYNEVAMGGTDASAGHHPLFPSRQHLIPTLSLGAGLLTPAAIELSAEVLREQHRCDELAARARRPLWRRIRLARLALGSLYRAHAARARWTEKKLQDLSLGPSGWRGIVSLPFDPASKWEEIADLWARSSELMAQLAKSAGAVYVHILQPNQYVENSKPISEDERRYAFKPGNEWSRHAREGHPYLQRAGAELARKGIHFHDLTGIFSTHTESLYTDDMCHFNYEGNRIVARAAAAAIADAWRAEKGPERTAP